MEKKNKNANKKVSKKAGKNSMINNIKKTTLILAIILISCISFFGIYTQKGNQMINKVKDYTYAMDINGARTIKMELSTETTETIKDSEGNTIEEATEEEIAENGYIKEEIPNNLEETKTEENYKTAKKIIEKRLKNLGVQNYNISLNQKTGEMIIEIPENDSTDNIVAKLSTVGKFEIIDSDTKEVLLNNEDIKSSDVLYNTTESGTTVYLEIAFNKQGAKKLREVSTTYVAIEEDNEEENNEIEDNQIENEIVEEEVLEETEENETTEKTITMKIDNEEIMTTSFGEEIANGLIQLSVGTATTDATTLQDYINQAQNVATVLDGGNLPLEYKITKNQYVLSDITENDLRCITIIVATVVLIGIAILIAKYKKEGLLAGVAYIGLVAIYLLLIRYANVVISIESIFGIMAILMLNYIFTDMLLKNTRNNNKKMLDIYIKFFGRIVPTCIIVIAFCFVKWVPISSFGMIAFWGLLLIAVYNVLITKNLLNTK